MTFNRLMIMTVMLLASSCAVGPDFLRPAAPDATGYTENALPEKTASADTAGGAAQAFVSGRDIPAEWWRLFSSPPLDTLIEQALKANPDLQAAEASLRQAQENVYAGEGALFPAVNANGDVTREKFSPAAFGNTGAPASLFTLYNASVSVSYGIDIFGGTRRELEALEAQEEYQRFQLEAAQLTLAANVVTASVQEAALRAEVKAAQDIVEIEQNQLNVLQEQLRLGAVAKTAVLAQEAALAQAQTALPPLQKQLSQQHNQLAALTGHLPSEKLEEEFDLTALHLPEELPVSLPSQLVEQRPDIRAAEAQLHAASAAIGVATAAMLPQITLSGNYGWETTRFSQMFTPSSNIWSLGAGLVQPIFHGGELLHERRAAVAAYDKAAAQYRSTVLQAFRNVADSLRALQYDADTLAAEAGAERAAADNLELAQAQFKAGASSYLALLDAQRTYGQTRIALAAAQATRFADTAALFQSLGGGWWNSTNPANRGAIAQDQNKNIDADKLCTVDVNETDPVQPLGSQDQDSQDLLGEQKP